MLDTVDLTQSLRKSAYKPVRKAQLARIFELSELIYEQKRPVIIVFEGWDASGKGTTIRQLTQRLDARGFKVLATQAPRTHEQRKPWLWRFWMNIPRHGQIAIFDRSWYGRVMVERVEGFARTEEWQRAYQEIKDFETQLVDFGTILLKFWIHIGKDEQLRRFEDRQNRPNKAWKLTDEDWRNRDKWSVYEQAVEDMLIKTTTAHTPWTVIAGNDKYFARVQVLKTVVDTLSNEMHVDMTSEASLRLPSQAAPAPVPAWALSEAKRLGIPVPK